MMRSIVTVCMAVAGLMLASCGSIIEADPKWEMPIVSKNCRSIDGYYYAYSPNSHALLTNELDDVMHSDRVEKKFSKYNILKEIDNEPYTREREEWKKKNDYPRRTVQIETALDMVVLSVFDADRMPSMIFTIDLSHARVGCNEEGDLTTHWLSLRHGAELTKGTALANETSIKKLSDGRLQVTTIRRTWVSNMNNSPDSRTKKVVVFERVR